MGKRKACYKPVKSKFKGNQYKSNKKSDTGTNVHNLKSASARKIVIGAASGVNKQHNNVNMIFNVNIMFTFI